jgi:iron complex outermembrane receptor protein
VDNVFGGPDVAGLRTHGGSLKIEATMSPDVQWLFSTSYSHSVSSYNQNILMLPLSSAVGTLQRQLLPFKFGYGQDKTANDLAAFNVTDSYSAVLEGGIQISDNLKLTSLTGYRQTDSDDQNDFDDTPFGGEIGLGFRPNPSNYPFLVYGIGLPRGHEINKYYSQELRLNYEADRISAVGGVFYQSVTARVPFSVTAFFVGTSGNWGIRNWKLRDKTSGIFGDVRYDVGRGVSVFGGLRYSKEKINVAYERKQYSFSATNPAQFDLLTATIKVAPSSIIAFQDARSDGAWSGRVGLQWRPTEGQNYYVSFNRGFKGAAADAGSNAGAPGRRHFADPETADNYEIGTKQRWFDGRLAWSLTAFDEKIKNVQQTAVNPGTLTPQLLNAGDLLSKGVEGQFQWAVTPALRLNGAVTYNKATYRGGIVPCNPEQLAGRQSGCNIDADRNGVPETQSTTGATAMGSPRWKYIVGADFKHDLGFLGGTGTLNVTWSWEGERPLDQPDRDPLNVEPSHGFLSASYRIVPEGGRWELMIYGRNLTNEFYYNGGTQVDSIIGRAVRFIPRDYKAFGGMTVKVRY